MEYKESKEFWPLPFRKLTSGLLRSLSDEDFFILCKLVYKKNKKYRANDRKSRSLIRVLMRRRKGLKTIHDVKQYPNLFFFKYKENAILDSFYPDRKRKWISPVRRTDEKHFTLDQFSFVDQPNKTLLLLQDIAISECTTLAARLDFSDAKILDIGPYIVWGLMSKGMSPYLIGGNMAIPVQKVIDAVNLRKFMQMTEFKGLADNKDVWAFPLKERNPGTPTATPDRAIGFSKVADQLVDAINEWLGALPKKLCLTRESKPHINNIVTEMLDNAERHAGTGSGQWYVAGFMARCDSTDADNRSHEWYDCHIAFVNLGNTISEAIYRSASTQIRTDLQSYLNKHHSRGSPSRDTLAALYAMQDGISSLPEGAGGKGMMDMVELTNQLGHTEDVDHQPRISIISGKSCVQFAGPYKGCFFQNEESRVRVQTFNTERQFDFPPDRRYVFDLDVKFPGTIVALRFSLDHEALEAQANEAN